MSELPLGTQKLRRTVLVVLALGISVLFLWMIWDFVMALLLAAIGAGMFHPMYERILAKVGGRRHVASGTTVGVVLLLFIVPSTVFFGVVATQALQLSQIAGPWVADRLSGIHTLRQVWERYPALAPLAQYQEQVTAKLAEIASVVGTFVVDFLATAARETATFFLLVFVMLYAMFFFLVDGRAILRKILYYLPLTSEDESEVVGRFLSVTRAAIKGTLAIGAVQGLLGGVAFWALGLSTPALWGTVMAVLSALPGVGSALVWVPAVSYLFVVGRTGAAIALVVWCAGLVGLVDNFLRPRLIGKDARMSDLMILVSTLGGIVLFGPMGFIVGPIVAALFVTIWELYGETFKDVLPAVKP